MNPKRSDRLSAQDPNPAPSAEPETSLFGVVNHDDSAPPEVSTTNPEPHMPSEAPPVPHPSVLSHAATPVPDPFDPSRLRLRYGPGGALGIHKKITSVPVRKPSKEWWVRTHSNREAWWLDTAVLELKEDRETYLVDPSLWEALATEATFSPRTLALSVERGGMPFFWPIRPPGPDGKIDTWNASAMEAALEGQSSWVRVSANMKLGAYELLVATGVPDEPKWPAETMKVLLQAAFRGKFIDSLDHPVLKRLRGEH